MFLANDLAAGDGKLTAQVKQVVLDPAEYLNQGILFGQRLHQDADMTVQFVGGAHGFHPLGVLGDAVTIGQAGGAIVSGSGVDLRKAVAHGMLPYSVSRWSVNRSVVVPAR